jgi:photosystem II stability/assembly factor-like uncharacterized protein
MFEFIRKIFGSNDSEPNQKDYSANSLQRFPRIKNYGRDVKPYVFPEAELASNWRRYQVRSFIGSLIRDAHLFSPEKMIAITSDKECALSNDGGRSWFVQSLSVTKDLNKIFFVNLQRGWILGDGGTLLQTDDSGLTWNPVKLGTKNTLYDMYFFDELHGWIVGDKGLFAQTKDGGLNWTIVDVRIKKSFSRVLFVTAEVGWLFSAFGDVYKTYDAGSNWESQGQLNKYGIHGVCFIDENTGWIGGLTAMFKTTNGGTTWEKLNPPEDPNNMSYSNIHFVDFDRGLYFDIGGKMGYTQDGGITWSKIKLESNVPTQAVQFFDQELGLIVSSSGDVIRTNDGGKNWSSDVSRRITMPRMMAWVDTKFGWLAGFCSTIFHTSDQGRTWEKLFSFSSGKDVTDIKFLDRSNGILCTQDGELFTTEDGGKSWTLMQFRGSKHLFSLAVQNTSTYWLTGFDGFLAFSKDKGISWNTIQVGQNAIYKVGFKNEHYGCCTLAGGLVLITHDGGKEWNAVSVNSSENLVDFDFVGEDIFVIGGKSVWKISSDGKTVEAVYSTQETATSIKFFDGTIGYIGAYSELHTTQDGGKTWTFEKFPYECGYLRTIMPMDNSSAITFADNWMAMTIGTNY